MKSILVIEDSEQSLNYMEMILKKDVKMKVDTASTAEVALYKLKVNKYDYILCDIELPKMTGPEILLESETHNAKIYFCTALDNVEEKIAACNNGSLNVVGWKKKPVFKKDLMEIFKDG